MPLPRKTGFTLVEMLVSMATLMLLVVILVSMVNHASGIWRHSRGKSDAFRSAREAFDRITTNIRQATLASYLDYYDSTGKSKSDVLRLTGGAFTPAGYGRASDLQFICGPADTLIPPSANAGARPTHAVFFQAPLGYVANGSDANSDFRPLNTLLNGIGYYIEFTDENLLKPGFITSTAPRRRYCLKELCQPSQNLTIYSGNTSPFASPNQWFRLAISENTAETLTAATPTVTAAENVIALIIQPEQLVSGSSVPVVKDYTYDTKAYLTEDTADAKIAKNQLPPLVRVTLVALDPDSGARLASIFGETPPQLYDGASFTDINKYDEDIEALERNLRKYHLNYRIFVSDVSVFGSQWSQNQAP